MISVSMVDSDIDLADVVEPRARELEEIVFLEPREVDIAGDAVTSIELGVGPAGLRAILAGNVVFQPADGVVIDREIDVSLPEWPGEEPLRVYSVSTLFRSAREIRAVSFPDMSLSWTSAYAEPAVQNASSRISETRAEKRVTGEKRGVEEDWVASVAGSADELLVVEDLAWDEATSVRGLLVGLVAHDRPVLILAEKGLLEYSELLTRLLREIHRMAHGVPRPFVALSLTGAIERTIELYATSSVALVKLGSEELVALKGRDEEGLRRVREKLAELFSQGYGFIVIYTDNAAIALREIVAANTLEDVSPPLPAPAFRVRLRGVEAKPPSQLIAIINMIWGRIVNAEKPLPPYGDESAISLIGLDGYARHADTMYYMRLARIAGSSVVQLEVPVSPEGESIVHYAFKAVAYLYLKHVLGYENVGAEHECRDMVGVLADVCASSRGTSIIVEVETLYGRGLPLLRLRNLIEERAPIVEKGGSELWIVLPPPQAAILPRTWLRRLIEWTNKRNHGRVKNIHSRY